MSATGAAGKYFLSKVAHASLYGMEHSCEIFSDSLLQNFRAPKTHSGRHRDQRMPTILCVCRLSRHTGFSPQNRIAAAVEPALPSIGCKKKCLKSIPR
jgi:hypothetical protein